jgi:hypothetical protein
MMGVMMIRLGAHQSAEENIGCMREWQRTNTGIMKKTQIDVCDIQENYDEECSR